MSVKKPCRGLRGSGSETPLGNTVFPQRQSCAQNQTAPKRMTWGPILILTTAAVLERARAILSAGRLLIAPDLHTLCAAREDVIARDRGDNRTAA